MPIDVNSLSPTELVRLLNSTPLGPVVDAAKVHRQMNAAGLRIGDGRKINLVRYVGWLARERDRPKTPVTTYEEKLRKDLERKLLRSRHGRDIGPIPPIRDPQHRESARQSFRD